MVTNDSADGHVKPAMTGLLRDFRSGFRLLWRAPGFATTAVLTLALGIGATTALFSVVSAVLLDPLPFPDSNKLIQVWRSELPALTYGSASDARYLDWRQHQRVFTDLGAWAPRGVTLGGDQGPERAAGAMASASFFGVMGAPPVVGRYFADDEDRRGGERVVVISEGLWRRRYQGAASVLGTPVQIDGDAYTIVGVAPAGFAEVWRLDVWLPLGQFANPANRGSNYLLSFGRLREGMTLASARAGLAELAAQMSRDHPTDKYTFTARPLHEVITEGATRGLWMLLAATGLLLLIACTNVANLLLARSVVREKDLAVRASLGRAAVGASRSSLLGMVVREGLVLSGAGIAAGAVMAMAASGVLRTLLYDVSATDPLVFAGSALGLAAVALAGYLIPASRAARVEPVVALRSE
jgi:putative ABC transport system permease protein